jgi:secreted trypsin-like serine protease
VTLALCATATAAPAGAQHPPKAAASIVGGQDASIDDWPSIAYLLAGWDGDGNGTIESAASCTGTVIAPKWIITAAHCAYRPDGQGIDAMVTVTGVADLNDDTAEAIRADKLVVDPEWDPQTLLGDAMLVHLASSSSRPAMKLADAKHSYVHDRSIPDAAGWGTVDEDSTIGTDVLQEAMLAIQKPEICAAFAEGFDATTQTCAGTPNTSGACHGDSGGPLIVFDKETGAPRLWGLTSYGPQLGLGMKPCDLRSPAVFSWVPGFAGFIADTTGIGAVPDPPPVDPGGPQDPGGPHDPGTPGPGGGAGGGGAGGGDVITPPSDTIAPLLRGVKLTPRKLRAAKGATLAAKRGAKLSFTLSEASAVTVTVLKQKGRRYKALSPSVPLAAGAGRTTRRFSARLAGKALKRGRYKLRLIAVDTAGNAAKPATVAFKVVR